MNLRIGLSALRASQFAINNVSHNLANAGTEGYHRQDVDFKTNQADFRGGRYMGSGVRVGDVQRMRDLIVESAFTNSTSDLSRVEQSLLIETRIESLLLPGEGSVQNSLTSLFDEFARLSANPSEKSLRNSVINQANNVAGRIQDVSNQFVEIRSDVQHQLKLEVEALNLDIETLVNVQNRINSLGERTSPNDLLDQRDQLVNRIAERTDIQRHESVQNKMGLSIAGSSISIGAVPIRFETATDESGLVQIRVEGSTKETKFAGGRIGALTDVNNHLLGQYAEKIDTFAKELIQQFDQAHSVGLGLGGPFSKLVGARSVADVDGLLQDSAAFPVEAGTLHFSVTSPDNERRTFAVSIDPSTDSLRDVAAKISDISNIQAVVDDQTGMMSIIAKPGYQFDFTGNLETTPDLVEFSNGTSVPSISGNYQGTVNSRYTVTALSGGTVGKSDEILMQIADDDGNVIKEVNVGNGYEAGTPIDIGDGVSISFSAGEISADDSFEVKRVANSDTTNFLSAIGMNNFFSGTDSSNIAVARRILESPDQIATSKSGEIGDTRNLAGIISLRDQQVLSGGRLTFDNYLIDTNAEIGFRVQSSQSVQSSLSELNFQYQSQRDSISGVDINEEMINLAQYQKQYEAAIQIVRTMESMLDELFQMIR